jgi:obg-like ATPase 1
LVARAFYLLCSALDKIIVTGYRALHLIYFFTCGKDEVKAWTIQVSYCCPILLPFTHLPSMNSLPQKGTKAPAAAGRIHTDFEKGFIMAEVMHFQDFKEEGSENAVKVSTMSLSQIVSLN